MDHRQLIRDTPPEYDISAMGEAGLLLHVSHPIDMQAQEIIWALAHAGTDWAGVNETIAGVNNLLVVFNPDITDAATVEKLISKAWAEPPNMDRSPSLHRIPVRYGGIFGPDLPLLCQETGLSAEEYIHRHSTGKYIVMAVGAMAGFGYLGGLDPSLAVPRRATPRMNIKAGSVIIGGAQTAVTTVTSPSGWNVIGQTDTQFFDPINERPAMLQLGDYVEFYPKETA